MTIECSQSVYSIFLPVHKQKELREWRGERSGITRANGCGKPSRYRHKKQQNKNLKITVDKFCIVLYTNKSVAGDAPAAENYGVLAQLESICLTSRGS